MHTLLTPFFFTGAQVVGDQIFVALWGGAGSTSYRVISSQFQALHPFSGSGGLLLARISGIADDDEFSLLAGGRGGIATKVSDIREPIGPAPETMVSKGIHRYGAASGAASALTINVGGTAGQEFLLIAPSGGGGGGYNRSFLLADRFGGHGSFAGDLGRTTIARGGHTSSNGLVIPGGFGVPGANIGNSLAGVLQGGSGDIQRKVGGRGGGGSPDGALGAANRTTAGDGGSGGVGFIHGGPSSGADETVYTTTYSNHGANITIEAIGFAGRAPEPWTTTRGQIDVVAAARSAGGATGELVTSVTNALGWATTVQTGKIAWPPVMQAKSATATSSGAALDLSTAAQIALSDYPGQAGQRKKDDGVTNIPNSRQTTLPATNWYSNGGGAMVRLGADGPVFGYRADDYRGGFIGGHSATTAETGVTWFPPQDDTNAFAASSASLPAVPTEDIGKTDAADHSDEISAELSLSANTTVTDLANGPIFLDQDFQFSFPVVQQIRDGSATTHSADLTDASPAMAADTNLVVYSIPNATNWSPIRATISENVTQTAAPDGTQTASKAVENTSGGTHRIDLAVTLTDANTYTFSIFAKAAERSKIAIEIGDTSVNTPSATFDLSTGAVVAENGAVTATIEDAGNGWFRCSLIHAAGTADRIVMQFFSGTSPSYTGDGSSGLYLWGAQLEEGQSAFLIGTAAGVRQTAAGRADFGVAYYDGTNLLMSQVSENAVETVTSTGSALTHSNRRGLAIDNLGFGFHGDQDGNIDVFDSVNPTAALPLALSDVVPAAIDSLCHDAINDKLIYSSAGEVGAIDISRSATGVPIDLQDAAITSSLRVARTAGNSGNDDKIFYAGENRLVQQDGNNLRLLDHSAALPTVNYIPSGLSVQPALGEGAFLSLTTSGTDFFRTNVLAGARHNALTFILVVRPQLLAREAFLTFWSGALSSSQAIGHTGSGRLGIFETDGSPRHGAATNMTANQWAFLAVKFSNANNTYSAGHQHRINGSSLPGGTGGSGATSNVNNTSSMELYFGVPNTAYSDDAAVDVAFARVYSGLLTIARMDQIFDHWTANNGALFTNNSQSIPTHNANVADYRRELLAEWDFSRMSPNTPGTTHGSAGAVSASFGGSATITTD